MFSPYYYTSSPSNVANEYELYIKEIKLFAMCCDIYF